MSRCSVIVKLLPNHNSQSLNRWRIIIRTLIVAFSCVFAVGIRAQDNPDQLALQEKWRQQQEAIQSLLPKLEAATVCLEAGGGSGSGVIVNEDGLIVTAAHVVDGQKEMTVRFSNGKVMRCQVLGGYRPADAALAKIIEPGPHPFVEMAKSGSVKKGQTIIALGHPSGFDEHRGPPLRLGHVHAIEDYQYSCDCALIGGDSGGPGFNLQGEVIGIHSTIDSNVSTNNDILIDIFHREWDSMLSGEWRGNQLFEPEDRKDDVVLGVKLFAPEAGESIRIQSVAPNSPAAWAGLQPDDRILAVNDEEIDNPTEFMSKVKRRDYGLKFVLTVQRDGETLERNVELLTRKQLREKRDEQQKEKKQESQKDSKETSSDNPQQSSWPGQKNNSLPVTYLWNLTQRFQEEQSSKEETNKQQTDQLDETEQTELQQLFTESQNANGQLTIEREKLMKLRKQLRQRMDRLAPAGGRVEDAWTRELESIFQDHLKNYSQSVFPVFVVGRNVASAIVINSNGLLLTKHSEIEGRTPQIRVNDETVIEVQIVATDNHLDLAIVQVMPQYIEVAEWIPVDLGDRLNVSIENTSQSDPAGKGTICCSVSSRTGRAAGIGVVSVASRSLDGRTTSYIGIEAVVQDNGIKVSSMMAGGPAERAGIKVGDVINALNNQPVTDVDNFKQLVESHLPGEEVQLGVIRRDSWLTLPATLGDKSKVAPMPGAAEQGHDSAATAMSRRRWNFTQGIQHDCAISPKACGGLLIDLDGRVIGINIARAGRIKSYAIPVSMAKRFVENYLNGKGVSE